MKIFIFFVWSVIKVIWGGGAVPCFKIFGGGSFLGGWIFFGGGIPPVPSMPPNLKLQIKHLYHASNQVPPPIHTHI